MPPLPNLDTFHLRKPTIIVKQVQIESKPWEQVREQFDFGEKKVEDKPKIQSMATVIFRISEGTNYNKPQYFDNSDSDSDSEWSASGGGSDRSDSILSMRR